MVLYKTFRNTSLHLALFFFFKYIQLIKISLSDQSTKTFPIFDTIKNKRRQFNYDTFIIFREKKSSFCLFFNWCLKYCEKYKKPNSLVFNETDSKHRCSIQAISNFLNLPFWKFYHICDTKRDDGDSYKTTVDSVLKCLLLWKMFNSTRNG